MKFKYNVREKTFGFRLFWILGTLLLAASFIHYRHTFDIHLHDTYIIVSVASVLMILGAYFIFCALVYWLIRKRTNQWLLTLHAAFIFAGFAFVFLNAISHYSPRNYLDASSFRRIEWMPLLFVWLLLLAQVVFIVNVLLALIKAVTNKRK